MKIDIVTTTRAEYGLMRPLIEKMMKDDFFEVRLIVSGTHLSEAYGNTYKEIEQDNIKIYKKIEILSEKSGEMFVSETMANALTRFTDHFVNDKPDFVMFDGDRYEIMAICTAAVNSNVPCIHLSGGDTTEGAADECYRHAITKMSFLHFPTTEVYRKRVIQMGENPKRVFTVGSLGIENIATTNLLEKDELEKQIGFSLQLPYGVVTFHPVTLEKNTALQELEELLQACDEIDDMSFIITLANADNGGEAINKRLKEYASNRKDKILCVTSLGALRYLSALKYAAFVMGNSSSGIIEAPSFRIPTINIGDRQRGRIQASSIINCKPEKQSILDAIGIARSESFLEKCKTTENPNGDGVTSEKIVSIIKEYCDSNEIDIKKKFYDITFEVD